MNKKEEILFNWADKIKYKRGEIINIDRIFNFASERIYQISHRRIGSIEVGEKYFKGLNNEKVINTIYVEYQKEIRNNRLNDLIE